MGSSGDACAFVATSSIRPASVVFIGILGNGLVLLGVNPYATTVVRGAVILVAVLLTSPGLRARLLDLGREVRRLTGGAKSE